LHRDLKVLRQNLESFMLFYSCWRLRLIYTCLEQRRPHAITCFL